MSRKDDTSIVVPVQQLIEIVSNLEPNTENAETIELLREMESLAERVDRKVWYQRKVVADLVI